MTIPKEYIEESRQDAIEDCDELLWLINGYRSKLLQFQKNLQKEKSFLPIRTQKEHTLLAAQLNEGLNNGASELFDLRKNLHTQKKIDDLLSFASQKKQEWGMYLRSMRSE